MDKNDLDLFQRCTAEFSNSVLSFGRIVQLAAEQESMVAANRERQSKGQADAYGEAAFYQLSERIAASTIQG